MQNREWYREKTEYILDYFNSSSSGLSNHYVNKNREEWGDNSLSGNKNRGWFNIYLSQLNSPLVYILIIASILMIFLGDLVDAGIILGVVLVNTIVGGIQEGKAEDTLNTLKKVVKSYANVVRNGTQKVIEDIDLVPGDIILLKDGSLVPADAKLIEATDLKVNQSALTGESEVVIKNAADLPGSDLSFNDQDNMVFRGTYVTSGLAKAVVVRTGKNTLIGEISEKLGEIDSEVPLKRRIKDLSHLILAIVFLLSLILMVVGIYRGYETIDMLLTVVAVAVSAIPESLPLVVTLVLASGVWRMSKRKVLVKRLQAVEALGQAKVVAVDKTGTITKNQMTVGKVYVNGRYLDVTGEGYNCIGDIMENGEKANISLGLGDHTLIDPDLDIVAKVSIFTAIADFDTSDDNNWKLKLGDPTEAALKVFGCKLGINKNELLNRFPQISEIPFDLKNKYHAAVNQIGDKKLFSIAGGPETIINKCSYIWDDGKRRKMTPGEIKKLDAVINQLSGEGYRILALAANFNPAKNVSEDNLPNLTFVGFVGISDAIRAEVYDAVKEVKEANMRTVMITGDHAKTAEAVARKVGIFNDGDIVLTGDEIDQLDDESLQNLLGKVTVFARVSPDNKMRIIEGYKKRGDIVAMTGDGINDALSLVAADLGVAMGQNGTEVAREAADLVLTDDNFGNIVNAAREGRNIYWIIRKSSLYLLSTNTAELLVIVVAVLVGLPLPLLATQILWLNLVTDTFLVTSLVGEPQEKDLMNDIYRRESGSLIDSMMIYRIVSIALLITVFTLYLFTGYLDGPMEKAWTISLTTLAVFQWFNILNIKSHYRSVFSKETFNNKYLFIGIVGAVALHSFAIYTPFMQALLKTTGLSWSEWQMILSFAFVVIIVEEIRKLVYRNSGKYLIKEKTA